MDPMLVTSGGQDGRPVQTCSLEDPLELTSGGYWSNRYGWHKWVVCILVECFPVKPGNGIFCLQCYKKTLHIKLNYVHWYVIATLYAMIIYPNRLEINGTQCSHIKKKQSIPGQKLISSCTVTVQKVTINWCLYLSIRQKTHFNWMGAGS